MFEHLSLEEYKAQQGRQPRSFPLPKVQRLTPADQAFARWLDQGQREGKLATWSYKAYVFHIDMSVYVPSFVVIEPEEMLVVEVRQKRDALEIDPETLLKAAAYHYREFNYISWTIFARQGKSFQPMVKLPEEEA